MLITILRLQSFVFAVYGLAFFLIPDFTMDTIFGWDTMSSFPRALGATFIGVAWLEWKGIDRFAADKSLVWPFVAIPTLLLVGLVWERTAGTYEGTDLFYWVSVAVTVFFAIAVGWAITRSE